MPQEAHGHLPTPNPLGGSAPCPPGVPSREPLCNCSLPGTCSAERIRDGQLLTREAAPPRLGISSRFLFET